MSGKLFKVSGLHIIDPIQYFSKVAMLKCDTTTVYCVLTSGECHKLWMEWSSLESYTPVLVNLGNKCVVRVLLYRTTQKLWSISQLHCRQHYSKCNWHLSVVKQRGIRDHQNMYLLHYNKHETSIERHKRCSIFLIIGCIGGGGILMAFTYMY